jgi:hypothetical protein
MSEIDPTAITPVTPAVAPDTGIGSGIKNLLLSLTAPSTPEEQAKAMKLAALLQSQQDSPGLETSAYKGVHAMPTAAAGFGNALLKGMAGFKAGGGFDPDPLAPVNVTPMIKL